MPDENDDRVNAEHDQADPYESTTRWIVEAGRRRSPRVSARGEAPTELLRPPRRPRTFLGIAREVYLFAVLVAVYLNYYFMQVMEEIQSLRSIIVFVPTVAPG